MTNGSPAPQYTINLCYAASQRDVRSGVGGGENGVDFQGEWHTFRSDQVALWFEGGYRGILTWRGDEALKLHMNGENILFERE
jgi:hypothetical protein